MPVYKMRPDPEEVFALADGETLVLCPLPAGSAVLSMTAGEVLLSTPDGATVLAVGGAEVEEVTVH